MSPTPTRMVTIKKKKENIKYWQKCREIGTPAQWWGGRWRFNDYEKQYGSSQIIEK